MMRATRLVYIFVCCLLFGMPEVQAYACPIECLWVYDNPSYDERIYDLVISSNNLLDDAVDLMPRFAFLFPAYHDVQTRAIGSKLRFIADHWSDFMFSYMRDRDISVYDVYDIQTALLGIVTGMRYCDPDDWHDFYYDFSRVEYSLNAVISAMSRPWYGWPSDTLSFIADQFEDVRYCIDQLDR